MQSLLAANPPHDYQLFCENFIMTHPYCGLYLEMGMGKTRITLEALFKMNPRGHVLIVAPKNIARSTWIDEIEKWQIPVRTRSLLVDEKGRDLKPKIRHQMYLDTLTESPAIYFINREKIPDLIKHLPCVNKKPIWPFPFVVLDESQSFKSAKSERFKALKSVRPCITNLVELTGTPQPEDLMDLWSQIYLLDQGQRLGRTLTAYRERWFTPGMIINNHPVNWIPRPGAQQEIYAAINDIVISMKNTQLNLPPVTYQNIYAHMDPADIKTYKTFMKDMIVDLDENTTIEAVNAAVLSNKLSQMASGAIYTDDNHNFQVIHEKKLELCEYLINNTDSPVLIAYHFQSDKTMLMDYLQKKGLSPVIFNGSPEMIHAWNQQQIPILLLQPASAGHGLNLQYGGHTLIWYTVPQSLEEYLQTNARLNRQGQQFPVMIYHLLTTGTIDSKILRNIDRKDTSQQALLQAVRVALFESDL